MSTRSLIMIAVLFPIVTTGSSSWADAHQPPGHAGIPAKLTEQDVAAIAAQEAPSVLAARHQVDGAEAEKSVGERIRYPDLVLGARYTRLSSISERMRTLTLPFPDASSAAVTFSEFLNVYSARATLVVPLTDAWLSLAANVEALGFAAEAKRLELAATQAQVTFEARAAFVVYRRAMGARRIAASALEIAQAQLADQQRRVAAGAAPASTTLLFEAAQNAATARLRVAEAEVGAAEAAVRAFLPKPLTAVPLGIEDGGASPLPFGEVEGSPLLRAALMAISAANARISAEGLSRLPRLALVAGAGVDAPSQRAFAASKLETVVGWDVTLQLEWSLSSLTTGSARQTRATAEREALSAKAEEVRRMLDAQQNAALAAKSSAQARVAAAQAGVETAKKLAKSRRTELAAGVATPLDLTTAESERVRAEIEQEDADLELRLAETRLALVAGYIEPSR